MLMKQKYFYNKDKRHSVLRLICIFIFATFIMPVIGQTQDSLPVSATYKVTGKVVDSSKKGFAGTRISVIGTRITAMTSEDGAFQIDVPYKDALFFVDAPGYQDQLVALKGRTEIEIQMMGKTQATSFYDDNILSTKGIASVSDFSKEILSIDEDITSRLGGQIRAISHSGVAGNGSSFFVRGLNSLNATAQPLIVIDGIISQSYSDMSSIMEGFFNNPLALLDPKDIEKITVLKDGTSLYGSKGANGVILIDTKRAHTMATDISVYMSVGYRSPIKSIPMMNAGQYRIYASDILQGKYDNASYLDKYNFLNDDPSWVNYKDYHNDTDWLGLINKGALTQNYGISVTGGDDVALNAFMLGYSTSDGNIEKTGFNRLNIRFNSDVNLTARLKLPLGISFSQTVNNVFNDGIDDVSSPIFLSLIKAPVFYPYIYNRNGSISDKLNAEDELGVSNPMSIINNGIGFSKKYYFNVNLQPNYTFGDKVKVSSMFSYSWNKLSEKSYFHNPNLPLINDAGFIYDYSKNVVKIAMGAQNSIFSDTKADWSIIKNNFQALQVTGGFRFLSDSYTENLGQGHNASSDEMTELSNTQSNLRYSTGVNDNWRSMSWYINADYNFKKRYLLNFAASMDASSRFGNQVDNAIQLGGASWGLFPSISGGWVISSEKFMKDVNFINFLKLSLGYSISGNDNLVNYANRSYFSSILFLTNATGLVLNNIGNEKLKWETTDMSRIGIDMSLFNNRLSVKGDFYSSTTKDLLTRKQLNDVAGLQYYWSNDGVLGNKGYEIVVDARIVNQKDWKLDVGASIGHYKNKITSLANGEYLTDIYGAQVLTREGLPAGVFYGYKTKGVLIDDAQAKAANLSIRSETGALIPFKAGDIYFEDLYKDGVIDDKDKTVIGDPNPDFYGNFNFNLTYKSFTLGALFTYSYGNQAYNAFRANLEAGSDIYNQSTNMLNRWVADGQVTSVPRATYGDPMGNSRFSDRWIEDASFMRFKSLSLSYKLPLNSRYFQEISVWGAVNNLYTFTKYLGSDPEFSMNNSVLYQGIDIGLTPQTRTFNLGIKINL